MHIVLAVKPDSDQPWITDAVARLAKQTGATVAVVAVDQVIRTRGAQPRTERNRLRMTLVRPDATWLVERVERL